MGAGQERAESCQTCGEGSQDCRTERDEGGSFKNQG